MIRSLSPDQTFKHNALIAGQRVLYGMILLNGLGMTAGGVIAAKKIIPPLPEIQVDTKDEGAQRALLFTGGTALGVAGSLYVSRQLNKKLDTEFPLKQT